MLVFRTRSRTGLSLWDRFYRCCTPDDPLALVSMRCSRQTPPCIFMCVRLWRRQETLKYPSVVFVSFLSVFQPFPHAMFGANASMHFHGTCVFGNGTRLGNKTSRLYFFAVYFSRSIFPPCSLPRCKRYRMLLPQPTCLCCCCCCCLWA